MKILFVSSEGLPYSKTGGLADVVGGVPKALAQMGHEVAVLLPRYRGNKIASILFSGVTVALGDKLRFPAMPKSAVGGCAIILWTTRILRPRAALRGKSGDYPDNAERFTEFSRAAIEFTKRVWLPDVIHCHDWQTALVPVILRKQHAEDPGVRRCP